MLSDSIMTDGSVVCFQWAYELGQSGEVKVSVPLHGCEHFYLLTKPLSEPVQNDSPGEDHTASHCISTERVKHIKIM